MSDGIGAIRRALLSVCAGGVVVSGAAAAVIAATSIERDTIIVEKDVVIGGAFGRTGETSIITESRTISPALAQFASIAPETPAEIASLGPIVAPSVLQTVAPPRAPDAYVDLSETSPADLTIGAAPDAPADAPQTEDGDLTLREIKVERGDTMITALMRGGLEYAEAHSAAKAVADDFDPRRMQVGDVLTLGFKGDGAEEEAGLLGFAIRHRGEAELAAQWSAEDEQSASFDAAIEVALAQLRELDEFKPKGAPKAPGPVLVSTKINSSLYQSAVDAGLSPSQVSKLTQIFGFRVDFQRSLRKGDLLEVYFERAEDLHGEVLDGPILFARLVNQGRDLAYYRQPEEDGGGYFDAKGESNKRTLMLTPIDGARITSGFGKRRHPILGYTKMHKGIDFGAGSGTPIYAAGDGVIEELGWKGGYGRYIRIRHNGVYKTAYAHMRAFRNGLKKGSRVTQGQTIGYVGTSGRSTGPHLHFEVFRQGHQVNPLKLGDFGAPRIDGGEFKRFKAEMARVETKVATARDTDTNVASAELN